MKKTLSLILVVALVLSCACFTAEAAGDSVSLRIVLDKTDAYGGDTVTMGVYLTAAGLGALETDITFDTQYLEYVADSACFTEKFTENATYSYAAVDGNALRLVYANTNGYTAGDEMICQAEFTVKSNVTGTAPFAFSGTVAADQNNKTISHNLTGASVSVEPYNAGSVTLSMSADKSTVTEGEVVTVTVKNSGTVIGGLEGQLSYDSTALEYVVDSAEFTTEYADAAATTLLNPVDGGVCFVYASATGCNSTNVMTMQFKALKNSSSTCLALEDCIATNTDAEHLSAMTCYTSNLTLWFTSQADKVMLTAQCAEDVISYGDEITVNVYAAGTAFGGLSGQVKYNAEKLEYVESSGQFSTSAKKNAMVSMVHKSEDGTLKFVYANTDGFTPDGGVLLSARFKVINCGTMDSVTLSGVQTVDTDVSDPQSITTETADAAIPTAAHVLGEWETTTEATFEAPGERTKSCMNSNCSYKESEEIPFEYFTSSGSTLSLSAEVHLNEYFLYNFTDLSLSYMVQNGGMLVWRGYIEDENQVTYENTKIAADQYASLSAAEKAATQEPAYIVETLYTNKLSDGTYELTQQSKGISSRNIGVDYTIRLYVRLQDGTYIYSPLRHDGAYVYCEGRIAKSGNAKLVDLCEKLLAYGDSAKTYFGG